MKSTLLVIILCLAALSTAYAGDPVLLWERDFGTGKVISAGLDETASTIAAWLETGEHSGIIHILDGVNGNTLWQIPFSAEQVGDYYVYSGIISEDGQRIAIEWEMLEEPEFDEEAYWSINGPWRTEVYSRTGQLLSQFPGGLGALSENGQWVYICGIPYEIDPDNEIYRYEHGLFSTSDATKRWSHILDNVADCRAPSISFTGDTFLRECAYKQDGVVPPGCVEYSYDAPLQCEETEEGDIIPETCVDPGSAETMYYIVQDGTNGSTLFTFRTGWEATFTVGVSRSGNYIYGAEPAQRSNQPYLDRDKRRLVIYNRLGQRILTKDFPANIIAVTFAPDESGILVEASGPHSFQFIDLQGNTLWTIDVTGKRGMILLPVLISSDSRVLNIGYSVGSANGPGRQDIVDMRTGQVVYTFNCPGEMSGDGSKVLCRDTLTKIQLWDISPLFQ